MRIEVCTASMFWFWYSLKIQFIIINLKVFGLQNAASETFITGDSNWLKEYALFDRLGQKFCFTNSTFYPYTFQIW